MYTFQPEVSLIDLDSEVSKLLVYVILVGLSSYSHNPENFEAQASSWKDVICHNCFQTSGQNLYVQAR